MNVRELLKRFVQLTVCSFVKMGGTGDVVAKDNSPLPYRVFVEAAAATISALTVGKEYLATLLPLSV